MSKKVIVDKEGLITYHKYVKEEYMLECSQAVDDMYEYRNELMANEQIRKDNEETRKINEINRVNAETERLSAEQTRDANEVLRVKHYNADVVAEKARVAKENERITAEQQRVINENARLGDEQIRVNQENRRLSNEDNRNTSENIRQANERARQTNNSKLTSDVQTKITEVTQITNECNSNVNKSIANINSCIDDLKGFRSEHNASIEAINNTNQEQNARMDNITKKNKEQDIYIDALLNEGKNKRITITEAGNEIKLTGNSEGFVTVDKVVGDTLVNLRTNKGAFVGISNSSSWTLNNKTENMIEGVLNEKTSWFYLNLGTVDISLFKPDTKYTILFKNNRNIDLVALMSGGGDSILTPTASIRNDMALVTTVSDFSNLKNIIIYTTSYAYRTQENIYPLECRAEIIGILEGDYTNKPIPQEVFEGMKSTFENKLVTQEMVDAGEEQVENLGKYKVDVKVRGKNLFPNVTFKLGGRRGTDGKEFIATDRITTTKTFNLNKGSYYISCNESNITFLGVTLYKDEKFIKEIVHTSSINNGRLFILDDDYDIYVNVGTVNLSLKLQIEENTQATSYEPYFEHTQTLYLNSPLLKGDELVAKEDGIYHWHKMSKVVLNGSEPWKQAKDLGQVIRCVYDNPSLGFGGVSTSNCICDKFATTGDIGLNSEAIWIVSSVNRLGLHLNKLKLVTQDAQGFKQWLQANPTTVVYELAEPYEEKISDFDILLKTPNNATLSVDSVIPPTTTITYTTDIPDVYSLEETNADQYDLIDVSLMATDEIYMMLEPILTTTCPVREEGEEKVNKNYAMINFYVKLVNRGLKDIDKVPEWLREDVIKELNK